MGNEPQLQDCLIVDPSADDLGLVNVGGELTPGRVLAAYAQGIFPWPLLGDEGPVFWCCPDPRFVLHLDELHIARRLERTLRTTTLDVRFDTAFEEVIASCATVARREQDGTWITDEMQQAFIDLHRHGHAHSVEAWRGDQLVGGLYGVSIGGAFFGESMFARERDASKIAFATLCHQLIEWDFRFVDCQQRTAHLARFGARPISRERFLDQLETAITLPFRAGSWTDPASLDASAFEPPEARLSSAPRAGAP